MGEDIMVVIEYRDDRGDWYCLGELNAPFRNSVKFMKIKDYLVPGVPTNSCWEAKFRFSRKTPDFNNICGKGDGMEDRYYSVGSLSYEKWLKHAGKCWFDPYRKGLRKDLRVVVGFEW